MNLAETACSALTAHSRQVHPATAAPTRIEGPTVVDIRPESCARCCSLRLLCVVTASFRILYVFVALEVGSRRLVHFNVTEHPTAEWTLQQLREALPGDSDCKFLLHDRHKTFSASLDEEVESWGIHILRSPVRMPTANAHCERLIGTIRRECLDYVIPLNSGHLRRILREWVSHYNTGRPHRSLGPGIPDRPQPNAPTCSRFGLCVLLLTDSRRLASRVPMGRCRMSPRLDFLRRTGVPVHINHCRGG